MISNFSGDLLSRYFVEEFFESLFRVEVDRQAADRAKRTILRQRRDALRRLGPVCGPRQVHDLVTVPFAEALGYVEARAVPVGRDVLVTRCSSAGEASPVLLTVGWCGGLERAWRDALRAAAVADARFFVCFNGQDVRLLDARRAHARRHLQLDLDAALEDEDLFSLLWALLRPSAFHCTTGVPFVERVIDASDGNTAGVCRSLRDGVLEALGELVAGFSASSVRRGAPAPPSRLDGIHRQSLTIVYRLLFLLFAESRQLVPAWHSTYRHAYSMESARTLAERVEPAVGLWEMLQAASRLSHSGCRAGSLRVTPFNGRLFSPTETPLGEHGRLDDESARRAVLALSTAPRRGGRARIVYRDLDVEQLGAVYESVLDYSPQLDARTARTVLVPGNGLRKATGTFYTPRPLTTYLVRRTLAPLVSHASPEQVLAVRVVDPAMGSGAFLVAACRYLASAYEAALVEHGRCLASDVGEDDRAGFRRRVAQRCLFGVDLNPMAVQLARLSLWLATLAPDKPLTFLDHRLVTGDSLVGASLDDVKRRPEPGAHRARSRRSCDPWLFDDFAVGPDLRAVLPVRAAATDRPDDSLGDVREKERLLAGVSGTRSPLARWKTVLDLWCARALPGATGRPELAGLFTALADHLAGSSSVLQPAVAERVLTGEAPPPPGFAPFHWSLEFPEVFYEADGSPRQPRGFDAVVGNPPWDMVRADNGGPGARAEARAGAEGLLRFARDAGIYKGQGNGHANRFQLFVERALQLVRPGGRIGLVVPWGLLSDLGSARLRVLLFDRTTIDGLVGFDNADRIFPIHRSVRFLALSTTAGGTTERLAARFGDRDPTVLDNLPSEGSTREAFPLVISRKLLERVSGDGLAVPDVRTAPDLALIERLATSWPGLSAAAGWHVAFGRELNATDDVRHFTTGGKGLPVIEGKHLGPFRVDTAASSRRIDADVAARLVDRRRSFDRPRLAYRDVSSPTNRLTLIAAIVPAGCVTVHTLFCLRAALPAQTEHFLCGVLNSLVANYFVRFWVGSHVTSALVGRLPVPVPPADSPAFRRVAGLAAALARGGQPLDHPAYSAIQAEVARLYELTTDELARILETFPLIGQAVREKTLELFEDGEQPSASPRAGFRAGSPGRCQ
jgi:hypothetical protein